MAMEVESAKCECCELREECTRGYIVGVKAAFGGRWLCGLCSEAVREEGRRKAGSTMEEAIQDHINFCKQDHIAHGLRQMLLRRQRQRRSK
ncbi:uncharacterized protein LOC100827342 [Brachypodium distachyon]|uniref:DUF1677 family protein n=1 Tax=Brachypodium distachyon TaxID=15368 RepID=I1H9H8_BRADI|nr:uncharacterized protein LOC100827342 [Brachypodium distachyon]PNT78150.1 hypothetical protein BRADI_1g74460v3 [Brachypodium distachyon]|eukprot:XP_014752406.1 uncharacterized protein LOC100827342 [Brachypodium distachyon]